MWYAFDIIRDLSPPGIAARLLLAMLCGGIIGMEREFKRRPAGFRTHILICIGAALTTMTSQYLGLVMNYQTDVTRLGAQVVAGIGFIGAGTIIVNGRQRVKGLTTAAGLWATAIIGLAIGAGFYEGGIAAALLVLGAELLFAKLEYRVLNDTPEVNLYMEYTCRDSLDRVLQYYRDNAVKVLSMQITRSAADPHDSAFAIVSLRLNKHIKAARLINDTLAIDGVISVEEL